MKKENKSITILFFLTALLFSNTAYSQGIKFEHGTWAEVKSQAAKEKKLIFVDVYTEWCGPCKKMAKEVFPLKSVGNYYNANFVNYKIDAEKGEGIEIAKKYGVASYPTYLYLDENGKLLHRKSAVAKEKEFIELAKIAKDPERRFAPLEEEFEKGNRNRDFVLKYFVALRKAGGSVDPKLGVYLEGLKKDELLTEETYKLIEKYGNNIRGKVFEILINNFESYAKLVGKDRVVKKISRRYKLSHSHHVGAGFAEKYVDHSVIDFLSTTSYPYKERLKEEMKINYLFNCRKLELAIDSTLIFLNSYASNNSQLITEMLEDPSRVVRDKKKVEQFAKWSDKSLTLGKSSAEAYAINMRFHRTLGNNEKALKSAKQAVDLYLQDKNYTRAIISLLDLAELYKADSKKQEALKSAQKAVKIYETNKDKVYSYYLIQAEKMISLLAENCTLNADLGTNVNGHLHIYPHPPVATREEFDKKSIKTEIKNGKLNCQLDPVSAVRNGILTLGDKRYYIKFFTQPAVNFRIKIVDSKAIVEGGRLNAEYQELKKKFNYDEIQKIGKKDLEKPENQKKVEAYKTGLLVAIKENKTSIPLSALIYETYYAANLKTIETIVDGFSRQIHDSYYLKTFIKKRDTERECAVGKPAPLFEIPVDDKSNFILKEYKGKYVLIDFWASWCGPCRKEIPNLKKLHAAFKGQNLEVVSISTDKNKKAWQKAVEVEKMPWLQLLDVNDVSGKLYNVVAIPHMVLINPEGKIVAKGHLPGELLWKEMEKEGFKKGGN